MSGYEAAITLYFFGMFQTAWMVVTWFHEAGRTPKPFRFIAAIVLWPVVAAFIAVYVLMFVANWAVGAKS